jgi:hypothetical protein
MVDHERTDYQPLRVRINGEQRWVYLPQLSTANNNRRRRNRKRWSRRANRYTSRGTSPMQWQDEPQHTISTTYTPSTPVSTATDTSMWWDDETTESPAINLQQDSTLAGRQSADVIEHFLATIRQEAESSAQAPAATISPRQQFCEWAERHSNADPLTPTVSASGEEKTHPPARRPLNPPPSWTAANQRVTALASTDKQPSATTSAGQINNETSPSSVLRLLQRYIATQQITVSPGIDDRIYLVVESSKDQWDRDSFRVPQPPNWLQMLGVQPYELLN